MRGAGAWHPTPGFETPNLIIFLGLVCLIFPFFFASLCLSYYFFNILLFVIIQIWTPAANGSLYSHDSALLCEQLSASEDAPPPRPNPGSEPVLTFFMEEHNIPVLIRHRD